MLDRASGLTEGEAKEVPQSLVDIVSGRLRSFASDVYQEWFGPLRQLPPVAPEGTTPRRMDYPPGYNVSTSPRAYEQVSFANLRKLADSYDLMRGVIETRKDQVANESMTFRLKKQDGEPDKKYAQRNSADPRVKKVADFFKFPDKEHDLKTWLRELAEEVLVIDAPCIYPRFTYTGELYSFDLVDGATIKRVINVEGKTPEFPYGAYQQILKGVPAVDLTRPQLDDVSIPQLVYKPRNPRVARVYGLPPVEQVMMTVNIALRRQLHQLAYFTDGNIPDAIAGVPDKWTPDQISKFEQKWDDIFAGKSQQRRKIKFIPWGGSGSLPLQFTKEPTLKDDLDEYIVRLICFFFSYPPNSLIKQVNRASGEKMSDDSKDEGKGPLLQWLAGLVTYLIEFYFGYDDIEASFESQSRANAKDQAEIDDIYLAKGVKGIDEVREGLGLEPLGVGPMIIPASGDPIPLDDTNSDSNIADGSYFDDKRQQQQEANEARANAAASVNTPGKSTPEGEGNAKAAGISKSSKSRKKKLRVSAGTVTKPMRTRIKALRSSISEFFQSEGKKIAREISDAYAIEMGKASDADRVAAILKKLDLDSWQQLRDLIVDELEQTAKEGGRNTLAKLNVDDKSAVFDLVDEWAVEFAQRRSAELVGMRIGADGNLVENPNAKWSIPNTTRERIRSLVEQAVKDGMTPSELAQSIWEDTAFSEERAEMVSRTELAFANVAGNMKGARESGVVTDKQWILGSEHDNDDVCDDNADQGRIAMDDDFDSGDDGPPAHPNCLCDVVMYTDDGDEE